MRLIRAESIHLYLPFSRHLRHLAPVLIAEAVVKMLEDMGVQSAGVFSWGALFHYATTLDCSDELLEISRRLALGLTRPDGFVAYLSIPTAVQTSSSKEFCHD